MKLSLLPNLKLAFGLVLLGLLVFCAVFAEFLAPYPFAQQHRDYPNAPPTKLHLDGFSWPPFVYATTNTDSSEQKQAEDQSRRYPLRFFADGRRLFAVDEPARVFLLGTDALGRDIFSRLLYAARLSLTIAALALLVSLPLALLAGGMAGFYGGGIDFLCMRLIELLLALPAIYLIIALRGALPLNLEPEQVSMAMTACLALFGWAALARITRGMALSLRERDFVLAAVALGASRRRIFFKHILPQLTGFALAQASLAAPGFMLAEVTLSYLGLGIPEPLPSWGNMLASAGSVQTLASHWWNLAPAAAIFIASLAFHLLAEVLKETFDPRAQIIESAGNLL